MFDQMWKSATCYISPGAKDGRREEDGAAFGGVVVVVLWFGGVAFGFLEFCVVGWLVGWPVGFVFRLFI